MGTECPSRLRFNFIKVLNWVRARFPVCISASPPRVTRSKLFGGLSEASLQYWRRALDEVYSTDGMKEHLRSNSFVTLSPFQIGTC